MTKEASQKKPSYKRILLKLSGETLQSKDRTLSIDPVVTAKIAGRVQRVVNMGVEIAIVVGGGNIFRGLSGEVGGIDRTTGDYMGMMATMINALALQNALEKIGVDTRALTAIEMNKVAEPFILRRALRHFSKGRTLVFAGGTGNPYFSTDSAAALRASEIKADVLLKATKVDGVYSSDPMKDDNAVRYSHLTYHEALQKSLKIMDGSAFSLCQENRIPIIVFDFFEEDNLERIVCGEPIGTVVSE